MGNLSIFIEFLKKVVFTTSSQLIWLLGLLFIFGFILHILARFTRTSYLKSAGTNLDTAITGWVGTPIHEIGHALFCLIFRHKISEIKLYSPNSDDGTLGYVKHSYNPKSNYQKIGNFFIGVGPIILGTLVLYTLLYHLVPNTHEVLSSIENQSNVLVKNVHGEFTGIVNSLKDTVFRALETIFQKGNFLDYKFWIFLYLSMCISSHMELSPSDIKGAWGGLLCIILFFFTVNLIINGIEASGVSARLGNWWQYVKMENYASVINKWVGTFGALFIFSTIVSGLNFFVTYFVFNAVGLAKGRGMLNPFWF